MGGLFHFFTQKGGGAYERGELNGGVTVSAHFCSYQVCSYKELLLNTFILFLSY